ncbi:sulfotransferase ssu-1-like [Argiope bruennichi]|uniref:Sulfotransferase 1C2A like protein n=1 Tax=Argiope bruennichi TaxID=94029 RepID=A0A8T0DXS7_ARGBR|nr:sulfotransferase ssu-1-like [Argiope bruennichi]KAF8763282.1 Sulfotransferase 1C2A like protein [Argiope bruennichi]
MAASSRFTVNIEGVNISVYFSEECFRSALRFKPKPDDVIIVTYPKCGTTWMQNLVLNILRRGRTFEKPSDFYFASPFLDQLGAEDSENMMIRPGCYKTHLPLHKVPWSDDSKYIYVARNPKDCCVSFYHHMKNLPGYQFADGTFEEFFDLFIKGQVEFGDYFDHLLPWYNARHCANVYFTTFEEMKRDLKKVAKEVATFVDENEARYLDENPEVLERILHNCSFQETKKMVNAGLSSLYQVQDKDVLARLPKGRQHILKYMEALPKKDNILFIRKGEIGSYKQELSPKQNEILNELIRERTENSDVMTLWEKCM